jgi:hypothetical protein
VSEKAKAYGIFIGKSEIMRPLGIPRLRWENNIKMDHEAMTCEGVDWINLTVDSVQDICTQWRWPFVTFAKIGLG